MSDGRYRVWLLQSKSPNWIGDKYAAQPEAITADELRRHIQSGNDGLADLSVTLASDPTLSLSLNAANRVASNLAEAHRRLWTPLWPAQPPVEIPAWKGIQP